MSKKKTESKELWSAAAYAAWTVIRFRPRLFVAAAVNEVVDRTVPFVQAWIAARIISELPRLVVVTEQAVAFRSIVTLLVVLLLVRIFQDFTRSLFQLYQSRQEVELSSLIERQLTEKFASLPYHRYEEKEVMDRYNLANKYANQIGFFVLNRLSQIFGSVYSLFVAAIAIIHVSPVLALIVAVAAVPQVLLELRVNREQRNSWRDTTTSRRLADAYTSLFQPQVIKDSRLFGLVQYGLEKAFHYGKVAQSESIAIDRAAEKYRLGMKALDAAIEVGSLAYVVRLIYTGVQPVGQFVFVQQVLSEYSMSIVSLTWMVQELDEYLIGAAEFKSFMELPGLKPGEKNIDISQPIRFERVSFSYPKADRPALNNVSLTIRPGQTIALVGENGAGKTTLVKLLMKLYEPSSGHISVAEQPLEDLDEHAWHSKLGVLFQDFLSFQNFTIRQNVAFGRLEKKADDKAVGKALEQAGAAEFVGKLPNGMDTYLGTYMDEKNGTQLSGGESQRLAIARVLFRDPDILIMDEPTSAVDAKAEYGIFQELDKARKGKTTIIISHRFSTVRKADYIYVLHKGRIAEQGTHDELLRLDGRYAELFNAQAEGYR